MKSTDIRVIKTVAEMNSVVRQLRERDPSKSVGLVPTMGALHQGHLALVKRSIESCGVTVVSIFVNPTQFAANEDLGQYPRPVEHDLALLSDVGADLVFMPGTNEVYPDGCTTLVKPPAVARKLEGESRPTHFQGVATVVLKLFNMVQPDVAFFGQKDYQQTLVVKHMVRDLNLPVAIEVCPIVRDEDGLALSSRNVFLSTEDRQAALALNRTLKQTVEMIEQGENDGRVIMAEMTQSLIECGVTETDYAVIVDADTLELQETVRRPAALLVAAQVGTTRLIDNLILTE